MRFERPPTSPEVERGGCPRQKSKPAGGRFYPRPARIPLLAQRFIRSYPDRDTTGSLYARSIFATAAARLPAVSRSSILACQRVMVVSRCKLCLIRCDRDATLLAVHWLDAGTIPLVRADCGVFSSEFRIAAVNDLEHWMRHALDLAERGRGFVEPNPMVGAVVLDAAGMPVGEGWHQKFGGPHAEVHALDAAGEKARGGTLIVTLEPCCHHGKTPPCTDAVLRSGVKRVVAAMTDPFPKVAGGGLRLLRERGAGSSRWVVRS